MSVLVQKYGGSSLGTPERIRHVAKRAVEAGERVCVVASAMGDTTDELLGLAGQVSPTPHARELDMLLSAGEQVSIALLSMAILDLGRDARLAHGRPGGDSHRHDPRPRAHRRRPRRPGEARRSTPARSPSSPGFQGVSPTQDDVTTLGRGGSDTTAVALAAALDADVCEIYTDVEGVFSADPRIVPEAVKRDRVSYEEMLELAASGAKVLAVALGRVRAQQQRAASRAVDVRRYPRNLGSGGGRNGAGDHLGHRARHLGGEGDHPQRARPAGHRRLDLPPARRRAA